MPIKLLLKAVKAINSNATPRQIGMGFAFGAFLGLVPGFNLIHVMVFFFIYLFNVNIPFAFAGAALYKLIAVLLVPVCHMIGHFFLKDMAVLQPVFTMLYNLPVVPWTRFYNTVVFGAVVLSKALFIPNSILMSILIIKYREKWKTKLEKAKAIKWLKHSRWFKWFGRISKVKDAI